MKLPEHEARRRFAASRHALLATVRPDGAPHVVPIVFALVDAVVYSGVDHKAKRSRQLQRVTNLEREPRCALLVEHYDDDWSQLWWVRADGRAEIVDAADLEERATAALIGRYDAYRHSPPAGPYLRVTLMRWNGWSAT